ncbi:MAG: DNA polymerase Y family protein [Granulosicoccus sp.]
MLWLALLFPQLPIDRQPAASAAQPTAVVLHEGPRKRILACNEAAVAAGVRGGQALKNAYAIVPDLLVNEFDEDEQAAHLEQLTLWALKFSSWVTPHPPNTILVEIEASLQLFGGIDALVTRLHREAAELGLTLRSAIAPTPSAAALFTQFGQSAPIRQVAELQSALLSVPVEYLPIDAFTFKGLHQSGIRTLGQLQQLPPASLTRRFGHHCTSLLFRLDGRLPDPQPAFAPPDTFTHAIDLPLEAPDTNGLAFPLNRLLGALGGYLRINDLGIRHLVITLYHHRLIPTVVPLRFLDATADTTHLYRVASERLAATVLPAPVTRLRIDSPDLASVERNSKDLFHKSHSQTGSIQQLLDRLMARLGKDSLFTALPGDDHRPEKAWLAALLEESSGSSPHWPARPTWLLTQPVRAQLPLVLTSLPERIENGWWDDTDVRRDYYIACDSGGAHYWVYRLRHDPTVTWIHGLFA